MADDMQKPTLADISAISAALHRMENRILLSMVKRIERSPALNAERIIEGMNFGQRRLP